MSDANNTNHVGASEFEKGHDRVHSLPIMQQRKGDMTSNSLSIDPADEALYSYESSPGNPFNVPTSAYSKNSYVDEHHDHGNESHHRVPSVEQQHWSMPSSEARTHQSYTHCQTHVPSSSRHLERFYTMESEENQEQADATSKNRVSASTNAASSSRQLDRFYTMESEQNQEQADTTSKNRVSASTNVEQGQQEAHTFSLTEQGQHHSKTRSNSGTDNTLGSSGSPFSPVSESSTQDHTQYSTNAASKPPPNRGKEVKFASEFGDDDIQISSFRKHEQQGSDSAGQYSPVAFASGTSNGSEKQNPPVQVMERSEDPTTSSQYRFPSHVFDRHKSKSNTQWSTASNESLFSIQMGNISFSGDMDKPGDMNSPGTFPSNLPPLSPLPPQPQPQPQSTKFNDISRSTAKQHECSTVTEEKAAETMREVIMENSLNKSRGDLITAGLPTASNFRSDSNSYSHHSDASTKSFAFNITVDRDKTLSSKHGEEKQKQQKQPEQENHKTTPDAAAQNPKSTQNATQNKSWLSCFPCC